MRTNFYKDAIIYQIYPRSFLDTNGDGLGDIRGIISKLDYLQDLGINCIWLSPIYDSPQVDNGYDISDYYNIYPPFGTLEETKELFDEAHKRGIKIIMDFVGNHTSDKHKWFLDIIKDNNSPYRDYYIVRNGKNNKAPTNWSGFFGEKAWEKIPGSDNLYYLHLFAKGQPDLNWENEHLREEIKNILKFWLDLGCDGFRCDVINLISKKQNFKNVLPSIALTGKKNYVNGPRLHEFLKELYDDVYSKYDTLTVGETVFTTLKDAKVLTNQDNHELDMIFNFDHIDTDNYLGIKYLYRKFKLKNLIKAFGKWQNGLYQVGWNSLFIENHDQRRSIGRFNTEEGKYRELSAKCLALTYFMLQGTPFIYQGQEIGMTNAHFKSLDETKDLEVYNIMNLAKHIPFLGRAIKKNALDVSRDNARTPMCWDDSIYAGFSKVEPWIRVNPNYEEINVKKALKNKDSLFYFYKEIIAYRKGNVIIREGKYDLIKSHNKNVYVYSRTYNNSKVIVISNFSNQEQKCPILKDLDIDNLKISNYKEHENILKPFETRLYEIK